MKGKWTALLGGLTLGICLVAPAGAGAATVTIGSPLTSTFTPSVGGGLLTVAMITGPNVVSPVDGTVVNWRTQGFSGGFRARVLSLGAGLAATGVASGPLVNLGGGTVDTPLSLPIKKGQVVGFDNTSGGDVAGTQQPSSTYASAGWNPPLSDGATASPTFSGSIEFAYNATVRYCLVPKLKGKKLGAAKKNLTNAGCAAGKVKKTKGKGAQVVRSQSAAPGTSLADGAKVDLKLGKQKAKKKS